MDLTETDILSKNVSYLRARDPSIRTGYFPLQNVRVKLEECLSNSTNSSSADTKDHLQVYLKIKRANSISHLYEVQDNNTVLLCKFPEGSSSMKNVRVGESLYKKYSFSTIFGPESVQHDLFNTVVKTKILDFINGKNCTLLSYGASGSGKTYTMVGTTTEPGLIPRTLEYLFGTLPVLSKQPTIKPVADGQITRLINSKAERDIFISLLGSFSTITDNNHHVKTYRAMQSRLSSEPVATLNDITDVSLAIWVSFAEIYNEQVYDLLKPEPPRGKQRPKLRLGNNNGTFYVKDLTTVHVTNGLEAYQILQFGLHNLKYASTVINSHSSRSHSIFTIKLAQASNTESGFHVSYLNFCDLAGAERLKKTNNVGDRLKESNNINTSLMILSRCINAVRDSQKRKDQHLIPFRESKLTQLFQKALLGHEDIAMFVNINPSADMFDETQHVLNFSAIAKDVIIERQQQITRTKKKNRFSEYLKKQSPSVSVVIEEEDTDDTEVEMLRDFVNQLTNELEKVKLEAEENEIRARKEVMDSYKELIDKINISFKKQTELMQDRLKNEYNSKLNSLKMYYENRLVETSKNIEVINLDSSSEEEESNLVVTAQRNEIDSLKEKIELLKRETELKDIEINSLKLTQNKLQNEIRQLEETLIDAKAEYFHINEELDKNKHIMETENLILRERVSELEETLADITKEMTNCREEKDNLEQFIESINITKENEEVYIEKNSVINLQDFFKFN